MSKRKTIAVDDVVNRVNHMLAVSTCSQDIRAGYCLLVEDVLCMTGNYKGFRYLLQDEVPAGELPGVNYENGVPHPDPYKRFDGTDNTRRQY